MKKETYNQIVFRDQTVIKLSESDIDNPGRLIKRLRGNSADIIMIPITRRRVVDDRIRLGQEILLRLRREGEIVYYEQN